ncbi:MAG TPA: hypothetical protein VGX50_12860, partial [Longimicrobium sp.]|nr:hypothetical protein [Longimicrobium sp.]
MPNVPFWLAKQHYAGLRRTAFDDVEREAVARLIRVPLRLADTDEETLAVWRATWRDAHPSGFGNWNWERILRRAWRRPSAFHVAVWSGEQLCGLGVGRLSKRRLMGVRHTISLHFMESAHDARHPLRRRVAALVISAAEAYGRLVGASRMRLMEPLPGVIG